MACQLATMLLTDGSIFMAERAKIPKVMDIPQGPDMESIMSMTMESIIVISMNPEDAAE